ncbi:rab3 GTPase-activating protein catalytic subunit-like isoform X2 [Acropora palmata]|uniref:rab3 GTPase-activating protein catalytic subunit-like isoform X2 n=1 Tax=Acropora palmata TaxID=6131 RepID=UPI003DA184BF
MNCEGARDIPAVAFLLDKVLDKASKLSWEMPQDLTQCEEFVKQLQLCELVVARAHSLRYKFQDALLKGTETDKDVEHFLSALMGKPEVTVIGAGRGPAGRVLHSLFVKQESAGCSLAVTNYHSHINSVIQLRYPRTSHPLLVGSIF